MSLKSSILAALEQNREAALSGQALAQRLGVSRNAVWKAVNMLKEEGYDIASTPQPWLSTLSTVRFRVRGRYPCVTRKPHPADLHAGHGRFHQQRSQAPAGQRRTLSRFW